MASIWYIGTADSYSLSGLDIYNLTEGQYGDSEVLEPVYTWLKGNGFSIETDNDITGAEAQAIRTAMPLEFYIDNSDGYTPRPSDGEFIPPQETLFEDIGSIAVGANMVQARRARHGVELLINETGEYIADDHFLSNSYTLPEEWRPNTTQHIFGWNSDDGVVSALLVTVEGELTPRASSTTSYLGNYSSPSDTSGGGFIRVPI